jgi:hypothetical protein
VAEDGKVEFDADTGREIELRFVRGETIGELSGHFELSDQWILRYLETREGESKRSLDELGIVEKVPQLGRGQRGRSRLGTFLTMSLIKEMYFRRCLSSKEIARQLGMSLRSVQRRLAVLDGENRFHGGLTTYVRARNQTEAWVISLLRQCGRVKEFYACRQVGPDFLALHDPFGWIMIECKKSSAGVPDALVEIILGTRFLKERTGQSPDKRVILYENVSRSSDRRYASDSVAQGISDEMGIEVHRVIDRERCPFSRCPDHDECVLDP